MNRKLFYFHFTKKKENIDKKTAHKLGDMQKKQGKIDNIYRGHILY